MGNCASFAGDDGQLQRVACSDRRNLTPTAQAACQRLCPDPRYVPQGASGFIRKVDLRRGAASEQPLQEPRPLAGRSGAADGGDGGLSLRGCIPRLFPLGSLALPPPSGDPDAAWELQGRVFAALAAVVHAKRGGALRPVPLPPCPRSATARRRRCWGPSRATTTILSDDAPPVQPSACAPQVRSCRPRSKN